MEKEFMIDSDIVKELRRKRGWTQEQLAQASGLSLRTIQRVEAESKASIETKVCLAATFEVELSELDVQSEAVANISKAKSSKPIFVILLASVAVSLLGLLWSEPRIVFIVANAISIWAFIYLMFNWYFTSAMKNNNTLKNTVRVGFIYSALFLLFSSTGQQVNFNVILSMMLSAAIFCSVYYYVSGHFAGKK